MRSIPTGARLFVAALLVYGVCPPFTSYDSYYVVPTALSLIERRSPIVDPYVEKAPEVSRYALERFNGHWYNMYPIAVPVLTLPLIALIRAGAIGIARFLPWVAKSAPHPILAAFFSGDLAGGHAIVELICGAFIGALTVSVWWAVMRRFLPRRSALGLTLLFAFGTTQWSIASRNLMQHGLSVLLLSVAIWLAIHALDAPEMTCWIALPVALAFTVRPSNIVAVAVFTTYVAIHQRRQLWRYLLCAAPVAAAFFGYSLIVYGRPIQAYHNVVPVPYPPALAVAANLVSPSRGVFVYMPVMLFALVGIGLAWRSRWLFPLAPYLAAMPLLHLLFIAPYWPGGHCFGPRYVADMTPFFSLFLAPAVLHWRGMAPERRRAPAVAFAVLAALSVFINLRGATSIAANQWSAFPVSVDQAQWRIWDWSDPQFLRGLK